MSEGQYELDQQRIDGAAEDMALQRVENPPPAIRVITPQEARNESIATMLDAAYQKASTLQLTADEAKALAADFPDEAFELGAGGDKNLLYLSHVYLRQRLNEVLGVGAAVPIRRREWSEEFTYEKDRQTRYAARVYVEMVLLVRGCVVGEAIADAIFYKGNSGDSYADTLEKAKSNAFRRCCKEFGVGLQPWMKGFCEDWKRRNRGQQAPQQSRREYPVHTPPPQPKTAPQANVERKEVIPAADPNGGSTFRTVATPASVLPAQATEKTREWAIRELSALVDHNAAFDYLSGKGFIAFDGDKGGWNGWRLEHVPTSKQALAALADEIRKAMAPVESQQIVDASDALPPEWADVQFSLAPKGMKRQEWLATKTTIGMMYRGDSDQKRRLFAAAKGWTPEPWVDGTGKKWPVKQEDFDCRVALDLMLAWRDERGDNQDA